MKKYTCSDYRQEMILVGLKKRLADPELTEADVKRLQEQIREVEAAMGLE